MKAILTTIGPEEAKRFLQKNKSNRKISRDNVRYLAEEMLSNRWVTNGETIIIGKTGRILDGQHRLQAIIKSGCTVETMLCTGVAEKSFDTINTGKSRNNTDVLHAEGNEHAVVLSRALNQVYKLEHDMLGKKKGIPNSTLRTFEHKHTGLKHYVKKYHKVRIINAGLVAAFAYWTQDCKGSQEFYNILAGHASGYSTSHPAHFLREKIIADKISVEKPSRERLCCYLVQAWNAHLAGKKPFFKYTRKLGIPEVKLS